MLHRFDPPAPGRPDPLPVQDLRVYERHGGHTLRKHVNKTPAEVLQRVQRHEVAADGCFLSLAIAQRCVNDAINMNRERVLAWMRGRDAGAPFTFVQDMGFIVGRMLTWAQLRRGDHVPRPVTAVRLVLRRDRTLPGGFTVVTAYPQRPLRRRARGHNRSGR